MARITQEQQVINALESQGGWATLRKLNEVVDFSSWATKTPEATVRRIVQESKDIVRLKPGLWALASCEAQALKAINLTPGDKKSEEQFTHGYIQGMIVEVGNYNKCQTFVPAQDKKRMFLNRELGEVASFTTIPSFTYEDLLRKARTVDVVWFNMRGMPSHFFEVEHTTDIKNSLSKFYELQDFYARFYIVADKSRKGEFDDKLHFSIFNDIKNRVEFLPYDQVIQKYSSTNQLKRLDW